MPKSTIFHQILHNQTPNKKNPTPTYCANRKRHKMRGRNHHGNYTNPCLTMHQPWASLLVYGIKRIEGRSWPAPIRGRLWIHAASKVPDEATIKAMEEFYQEIYAVNGITDIKFPEHYPVSRLVGCVEVVGCVRGDELASWDGVPEGVRLEALTDFCWLCERPQKLVIPFEMRGYQGVYNLERKIYDAAVRGVTTVEGPLPVRFSLPNPNDTFSLKPGSLSQHLPEAKETERSSSLSAAIAGAKAAATQFSKKNPTSNYSTASYVTRASKLKNETPEEVETTSSSSSLDEASVASTPVSHKKELSGTPDLNRNRVSYRPVRMEMKQQAEASSKMFAAAIKGLKPS